MRSVPSLRLSCPHPGSPSPNTRRCNLPLSFLQPPESPCGRPCGSEEREPLKLYNLSHCLDQVFRGCPGRVLEATSVTSVPRAVHYYNSLIYETSRSISTVPACARPQGHGSKQDSVPVLEGGSPAWARGTVGWQTTCPLSSRQRTEPSGVLRNVPQHFEE